MLSIHTTITRPDHYKYAWREALESFLALADEVIVVYGDENDGEALKNWNSDRLRGVFLPWPEEWHWAELPKHLNAGLRECKGEWALKMDIDYILHEKDIPTLRYALENKAKNYAVASMMKCNVINRHGFYRKTDIPFAINKGVVGDTIQYGIPVEGGGDWCYPVYNIKEHKEFEGTDAKVPVGNSINQAMICRTGVDIYDYDYFFRDKETAKKEFARFARSYNRGIGPAWGTTEEESWQVFLGMMKGRAKKDLLPLAIESHPSFIQERVRTMTPDEFGYNNWCNFNKL